MKKDDEFGCYRVKSYGRIESKCWRTCVGEQTCGPLNWCNIDNSKCTLSQYKKAACVNRVYYDDIGACPETWEKRVNCNERAGVSYDCDSTAKCRRSCESGESGCRSDGSCYVNDDNHKACSSDESCKIATYYPCLG